MSDANSASSLQYSAPLSLLDKINKALFNVVCIATVLMVLITFAIVVLRYGFSMGWIALQESVMYLHAIAFMLGMAYTLRTEGHVRVDVLYRAWSEKRQVLVNLFGTMLLLLPFALVVLVYSLPYVSESWRLLEASKEAGGLPLVYILKTLIPLMAVQLILQALSDLKRYFRTYKTLRGQ